MHRIIAYLLFLVVAVSAAAQVDVSGTVVDNENDEPLTGASVIVKGADGKIRKYASSKGGGGFAMTLPSVAGCRLEVTMMGFAKQSVALDSVSFPLTVRLEPGATLLKEVKVKADAIREQGDTVTYSVGSFAQEPYYVLKSFADSKLTYYDTAGLEKYVYEETPGEFNWGIGDSTKVVLGYECVMASTDFHGRHWTVWFSPEIPVADGPWKFCGLPGLILEATADGGQYSFVATGIEQTPREVGSVYLAEEYERTTRKDFLKARRAFLDNPLGQLNAQLCGIVVKVEDKDGAPAFAPASVVDFIETDYH